MEFFAARLFRRLIKLFFDLERFAHHFNSEFFKPMRGFGVWTLPRQHDGSLRDCPQEVHNFNHQAVSPSSEREQSTASLDCDHDLGIVDFYKKLARLGRG
jgi:hypothetical protein